MSSNSLDSLEDRIQKPGYLLLLVVVLLFLIVGLVDLIDYIDRDPVIFGRYTLRYFVVLIGYILFTLAWASLLLRPNDNRPLTIPLDFIQMRPVLAIGVLALMGVVMLAMINAGNTIEATILTLPAFQVTIIVVILLFSGLILFYKWDDESRPQRWRKIIVAGLGVILAVELLLQALAFLGLLPGNLSTTESFDDYSPYSRIYYSEEGLGSGLANNYGRYAPPFELLPESYRIAVLGDSFVEGLQVQKDQNFGALIEEQLATDDPEGSVREVLSLGYPDQGPGMYLSNWMLAAMIRELDPDEAIVFFDLGSDFQTVESAGTGYPYFVYEGQGTAQIDTSSFWIDLHRAEHYVHRGYEGFQPVLVLKSNYLTPRLLGEYVRSFVEGSDAAASEIPASRNYEIDLPNGFVFNERTNEDAIRIASAQINMAREQLDRADVDIKLITNPAFTEAFYEQETWNTVFGDSDLLLPEQQLREAAGHYGIPFLGLGTYMAASGMTPAEVQELYFDNGRGRFTPAGHEFAAEAVYQCFFAQTVPSDAGCDIP